MIEIPASSEHVSVLANALVGMAESVGRRALNDDDVDAGIDGDRLADWISELAWFGLRGVRIDEDVEGTAGAHVTGASLVGRSELAQADAPDGVVAAFLEHEVGAALGRADVLVQVHEVDVLPDRPREVCASPPRSTA